MTRIQLLLTIVVAFLLVALFYVVLWQPKADEIVAVQAEIESVEAEEQRVLLEIERLRGVREASVELEASLSAAGAVVPASTASPALLRQLQLAADEAGLDLQTVTFGRPSESALDPGLAEMTLNVAVQGSYFQMIDFLRRVEDPAIVPRGVLWGNASLSPSEYPVLNATLTGRAFAHADGALPADVVVEAPAPEGDDGEDAEGDADPGTLSEDEDAAIDDELAEGAQP